MASITCEILKSQNRCGTIGESCRLTCGKCTKCPTPAPCTNGKKSLNVIQIKSRFFDEIWQGFLFQILI